MLPSISIIDFKYRKRRTGIRKTFQIAEILPNAEANVLVQADLRTGKFKSMAQSKSLMATIGLFTGLTRNELNRSLREKEAVLKYLVKQNINTVDTVGRIMAEYYTNEDNLMRHVKQNKPL